MGNVECWDVHMQQSASWMRLQRLAGARCCAVPNERPTIDGAEHYSYVSHDAPEDDVGRPLLQAALCE